MDLLLIPRKVTQAVTLLTSLRNVLRFIPVRKPNILAEVFMVSLSSSRQMQYNTLKMAKYFLSHYIQSINQESFYIPHKIIRY